jgi:hypothetical protein
MWPICVLKIKMFSALSYSGIHSTASSDGITVDIDVPTVGFVKDGIGKSIYIYK